MKAFAHNPFRCKCCFKKLASRGGLAAVWHVYIRRDWHPEQWGSSYWAEDVRRHPCEHMKFECRK